MSDLPGALPLIGGGYLLGAIPVGWLISRLLRGPDLREAGSGRIGTTNALRTIGPAAAVAVLMLDVAKGAAAVLLARGLYDGDTAEWVVAGAGLAATIGHIWPIFLGFRGGRGVATSGGALLALLPVALPLPAAVLLVVTLASRYVSLGSISAALALPLTVAALMFLDMAALPHLAFAVAASGLVLAAHADNITRLRAGTERRIGQRETG